MDPKRLNEERQKLIADARSILELAEEQGRELTTEEQTRWDTLMRQAADIKQRLTRWQQQEAEERELGRREDDPIRPGVGDEERGQTATPFARFLRGGLGALSQAEIRAMSVGSDVDGGYLRPEEQFVNELIQGIDDQVLIRQFATPHTLDQAGSLGFPALDTDVADAEWTSEVQTAPEETTGPKFGKRELRTYPLAKLIKVSRTLLRQSRTNVEEFVRGRFSYKFAVTAEKGYLVGDGIQKPLGVFVASTDGISTSRDVSTDNTTTAIGADNLFNVKYALKAPYRRRARWLFHRDAVLKIAKLKDQQDQYLWQPGLVADQPDRILNMPVMESEFAPNTFTTGLYVGLLGDFSFYWYVDSLDFQIQRLDELYAPQNQVGFIGRMETGGQPVLEEAFVRVKLA